MAIGNFYKQCNQTINLSITVFIYNIYKTLILLKSHIRISITKTQIFNEGKFYEL